jgi:hypothetical protein
MVLKYGPIPPAHEPERTRFLTRAGRREAGEATAFALKATYEIERHLAYVPYPFAMYFSEDWDTLWARFQRWHILACQLRHAARLSFSDPLPGQADARQALIHAAAAYRYLRWGPFEHAAHVHLHRIGELVGGIYGCWYEFKDDRWMDTCLVSLAHTRMGLSAGFTARRLCSICGKDVSECEHHPGWLYPVDATREDDGTCNVCGEKKCDHVVGATYYVRPSVKLDSPVLREVSLTPEPRDPSLLITSMDADPQPPPPSSDDHKRRCLSCFAGICGDRHPGVEPRSLDVTDQDRESGIVY